MSQPSPIDELRVQVNKMLDSFDPEIPISATVAFKVNPATENTFMRNAGVLTDATRMLPGCNIFAYHKRRDGKADGAPEYLIYEDWETVRQFRAQWDSDHLKEFQHTLLPLITELPDLRWYYGWSSGSTGGYGLGG
jgi:quinol monooxygenase YgiN